MLRVVFAVALAALLLSVAVPVVEDARRDRTETAVRADLAALERAGLSLLETDEHAPGPGARRSVTVDLPERAWASAGVAYVSIGGPPGERVRRLQRRGVVVYRVHGGERRRVTLGVPLLTSREPVVLRGEGQRRLVLGVRRVEGRRAVVVRAAGD